MGSAVHPEDEGYEWRGGAGLMAGTGGPSALDPPHASALYLGQPPPRRVRDYSPAQPPAQSSGRVASSSPATLTDLRPVPPPPADLAAAGRRGPHRRRRGRQRSVVHPERPAR